MRRAESRTRDLDNPTAQFPIGAMYRDLTRQKSEAGGSAGVDSNEQDVTDLLDWDDAPTAPAGHVAEPSRRSMGVTVDMRFFALWLAAACVLGLLAALAATAAVLYR